MVRTASGARGGGSDRLLVQPWFAGYRTHRLGPHPCHPAPATCSCAHRRRRIGGRPCPEVWCSACRSPSSFRLAETAIGSISVVSVISLIVAAAGVAFGVYRWNRQRGHVRVQVDGGQAELYLRVVVDAPTPVHVNGIGYRVKGHGHLRRLLHWLDKSCYDGSAPLRRRLATMWRFRDMDLMMGHLERTAPWDWDLGAVEREEIRAVFSPIAGRSSRR